MRLKMICAVLAFWTAWGTGTCFADYASAKAAFDRRDYQTAHAEFLPLAEAGDPRAQFFVGLLANNGWGVRQDYREAAKWYRLAAEQGNPKAQCNLGMLLGDGLGVPRDLVESQMWFLLAAQSSDPEASANGKENAQINAKIMTAEQLARAKALAQKWKPKSGKK